jgi:hypothetical protein
VSKFSTPPPPPPPHPHSQIGATHMGQLYESWQNFPRQGIKRTTGYQI